MPHLTHGLYETLVTEALDKRLSELPGDRHAQRSELRSAEAADRIAWHIASVVERVVEMLPDADRVETGIALARSLVDHLVGETEVTALHDERPRDPAGVLRAVQGLNPDGSPTPIGMPLIPLLDSALLTNSPGEPRLWHQLAAEIGSAQRIDLIMAFIRRSGIRPLRDELRRQVEAGGQLRVITTTYTGSTEAAALEWLQDLGAEIRVSYDTTYTRLHAKAWIFHRDTGFSTAYVGSSNLTYSAQAPGLEWNIRISGARTRSIVEKMTAVFESYWEEADFEPYDQDRFALEMDRTRPEQQRIILSPTEIRPYPFQERLLEQITLSRQQGWHRNLLVAATGTGKTVMAAVDYQRLRQRLPRARLLFVAHREEILTQSRATLPTHYAMQTSVRNGSAGVVRPSLSTSSPPFSR